LFLAIKTKEEIKKRNIFQIMIIIFSSSENEPLYDLQSEKRRNNVSLRITYIAQSSDDKFYIHMRISRDTWDMLAHFGFVVVYLLGEGYVIPVCVRVIQIFTVTERVSG